MSFFDEDYIKFLKAKEFAGTLAKRARPALRLAILPEWAPLRDSINSLCSNLPLDSQKKLRAKRNDLQNIWQTTNEIKVGAHLVDLNYEIEHEKKFGARTPDWFVKHKDGSRSFIIEVFTKTLSDESKLENEYLTDLSDLSKNIPIGAVLIIKPRPKNNPLAWSDEFVRTVVGDLGEWLKSNPQPGSSVNINGLEFTLVNYSEKFNYVHYAVSYEAFVVNTISVKNSIEEKVERYRKVCNENQLPLVIACLPDFSTAIEKEEFEEICLHGNLFQGNPELSSVWAFIDGSVEIFDNPSGSIAWN
jgi:hypothetical protein